MKIGWVYPKETSLVRDNASPNHSWCPGDTCRLWNTKTRGMIVAVDGDRVYVLWSEFPEVPQVTNPCGEIPL